MKRLLITYFAVFAFASTLFAQLDSIHWMPPMHTRTDWGPQFLNLSTPETTPFAVTIRDGSGNVITTANISNSQPFTYSIGATDATYTVVNQSLLHKALRNKGLIIEGTKKFYAYFRTHSSSNNQAADLTCKGRAALGTVFRIGHLLQELEGSNSRRSNFVGILATEDSTQVKLSGFRSAIRFRVNGASAATPSVSEAIVLQKGESVVYSNYIETTTGENAPNALIGALVEASKPVAVNCGSWLGAPTTQSANDAGIDQIVPIELVGKEYVLCKGNAGDVLERPIVVAHEDNTQVFLNGSTAPAAILNAGDFFPILTTAYTANNNLHIKTSKKTYVYQMIGAEATGSNSLRTAGLIFVPPISCAIPNSIDNIVEPNKIGTMQFNGGVMITAMRDSQITVLVDGNPINLGAAATVQGNPDFVTYRNLTIFNQNTVNRTISVVAKGAVQVAMYGQNNAASFAAFYSGFSKTAEPTIKLRNIGDGICPDTLVATGRFDGVQWVYEDSILKFGKDTFLITYAPGKYKAVGYLGVCRQSDTAEDTLSLAFKSPDFPYTTKQPSCFGLSDGQISFGRPAGGLPPYQYSIDNGLSYSKSTTYAIKSGVYKLIVRDSLGCYNRPLSITVGQPDSLGVKIIPLTNLPTNGIPVGQLTRLEGQPSRKIVSAVWLPNDSTNCRNCLTYVTKPTETFRVRLTVTDSAGCTAFDTITLYVQPNVFAPNVIYPHSTVGNQNFILYSRDPLPIHRLAIYDRWGEHIFETKNIETNDLSAGWDATFKGVKVPLGVYVFFAEVEVLPGKVILVKGDITVLY